MKEPLLRLATAADLPHVAKFLVALGGRLFVERLDRGTPTQYYRWKYHENPAGQGIVAIAVTEDHVVSTAAATPVDVQVGERRCRAYILGDFFTVPSFRRQGLFSRLLEMVCREAARRGADLLYVQPNDQSAPLLEKQGFTLPIELRNHWHAIPSNTIAAKLPVRASVTRNLGLDEAIWRWLLPAAPADVTVRPVEQIGPEFDALWERLRTGYGFLTARDSARLEWRFLKCPAPFRLLVAERGQPVGWAALAHSPDSNLTTLSDLFAAPDDEPAAVALLRAALEETRAAGRKRMYAWAVHAPARTAVDSAIRQMCPVMMREPVRVAVKVLANGLTLPEQGWRLGPADFDGV